MGTASEGQPKDWSQALDQQEIDQLRLEVETLADRLHGQYELLRDKDFLASTIDIEHSLHRSVKLECVHIRNHIFFALKNYFQVQ